MKKFALCSLLLFAFCFIVNAQNRVSVAVIVDADNLIDESLVKEKIETAFASDSRIRLDYFPAKLQITASIKSIDFQGKIVGYAVSYVFTEGVFYKKAPRLVYLSSGVITAPELTDIATVLVERFEPILEQKRL